MPEREMRGKKPSRQETAGRMPSLQLEEMDVKTVRDAIRSCTGMKQCAYGKHLHQALTWLNAHPDSKEAEKWKGKISIFNASFKDPIGRTVYAGVAFIGGTFIPIKHELKDTWQSTHRLVLTSVIF